MTWPLSEVTSSTKEVISQVGKELKECLSSNWKYSQKMYSPLKDVEDTSIYKFQEGIFE